MTTTIAATTTSRYYCYYHAFKIGKIAEDAGATYERPTSKEVVADVFARNDWALLQAYAKATS